MATIRDQQQQPNFYALSGYLQGVSIEVDRCANLVAVHEDDRMTQLHADLQNLIRAMNSGFEQLRGEMRTMQHSLEQHLQGMDYNGRARALNSRATRPEAALRPLRNTITHEIVALPLTRRDLQALNVPDIERLLRELGQVPTGTGEEKKTQLKEFIGISV